VTVLVLGHDDVIDLLPMAECVPLMRDTLAGLARGDGYQPLRSVVRPPGLPGFMALMPAYAATGGTDQPGALGVKLLGIFPGNPALGKDAHQGVVLLLDPGTGEPVALLDASAVTAVRTAAVSAVATDALARPGATRLAILGTGVQARWHIPAIATVRRLTEIRVAGRDPDRAAAFAAEAARRHGLPVIACQDAQEALAGAEIVVTATNATQPVLRCDWLEAGTHINAVGACVPTARELDTETVAQARLVVDRRESALAEAGDVVLAAAQAGLGPEHIAAELGEVLIGAAPGRRDATELTVFESLGLAVEDLAAAAHVHRRALAEGRGTAAAF
jgi:ornithine cyclodeaminase/alanine dehydrogenase-like protein (mu-crystallin family)